MNFCADCGTALTETAKFCPECGTTVGGAAPHTKPPRKKLIVGAVLALAILGGGTAVALGGGGSDDGAQDYMSETEGYSDSEGYSDTEGSTCLEWETKYGQRYVGFPHQGGYWEQYPMGQTCVRYG